MKQPASPAVKALSTTDCDQWHLAIAICGFFSSLVEANDLVPRALAM
jgi:hypothetical protein